MKTTDRLAPIKYLFLTVLCQLVGATFASGLASFGFPLLALFVIHSIVSGYLSLFLRLSKPWCFLNFMIPAGLLVSTAFPTLGWIWLVLLIVFAMLFLPTFWTRVPYYPSTPVIYKKIEEILPQGKPFRFLDIGCGDSRLLCFLARQFPAGQFEGVDLSPTAILGSKVAARGINNLTVSFGDYWKKNFGEYDFVYAFLSPTPMPEIENKAARELKHKALLLVNSFELPNWKPKRTIAINDSNQSSLLVYEREGARNV